MEEATTVRCVVAVVGVVVVMAVTTTIFFAQRLKACFGSSLFCFRWLLEV
jgi:hypothetical protein